MAPTKKSSAHTIEIDRLVLQLVKDPRSKVFMPLAEAYFKAGMWQEAAVVLEDGLKYYPGFITAMVALGRAYDHMGQSTKAKAILEEAVKLSPENLRAHRTLVKIYAAQGITEAALRSCAVILAANPQDEEALSIQAQLGTPIPQGPPTPIASMKAVNSSAETSRTPLETDGGKPNESVDPPTPASVMMASTLERIRPPSTEPVGDKLVSTPEALKPSTSSPANIVSQLETWLRTIRSRRRDRNRTSHTHPTRS